MFGAAELGRLAGWWHDLGKASAAFQHHVLAAGADEADRDADDGGRPHETNPSKRRRVDHSTAGARWAAKVLGDLPYGKMLAYAIAGHHGRLPDWAGQGSDATLTHRLDRDAYPVEPILPPPAELLKPVNRDAATPAWLRDDAQPPDAFTLAFLTRMLYSALIDADRLKTERFCSPDKAQQRPVPVAPAVLLKHLDAHLDDLTADRRGDPAPVDRHRAAVLAACRQRAADAPGLFSLTVPTGGGKTFASLAFALEHAAQHGLRRVVYALPFTSIIEQTADTFRRVFADLPPHTVLYTTATSTPKAPPAAASPLRWRPRTSTARSS